MAAGEDTTSTATSSPSSGDAGSSSAEVVYPLPATVEAPSLARRYLDEHGQYLPPELLADALILVSELVTNAVRHGRPEISLSLKLNPPSVGVAVRDEGDPLPELADGTPSEHQASGRGLLIVSALASSWGVEPTAESGKTVWFELRA